MMERRIFDWRFVAAFAVMMLVAVASWGFVQRQHQINGLITVAQRTTAQVENLSSQLEKLRKDSAAAQAEASAERDQLRRQNRVQRAQFRSLLRYLREHGIEVPAEVTAAASGGGAHPKGHGPQGPKPTSAVHPPLLPVPLATPGPTATLTPTTPTLADQLCALLYLRPCPLP